MSARALVMDLIASGIGGGLFLLTFLSLIGWNPDSINRDGKHNG